MYFDWIVSCGLVYHVSKDFLCFSWLQLMTGTFYKVVVAYLESSMFDFGSKESSYITQQTGVVFSTQHERTDSNEVNTEKILLKL